MLSIIIDNMDKRKLVWPQSFRKPKSLDRLLRPRMVCALAMAQGWVCEFFFTYNEALAHGANQFCEVLSRPLDAVAELATVYGIKCQTTC